MPVSEWWANHKNKVDSVTGRGETAVRGRNKRARRKKTFGGKENSRNSGTTLIVCVAHEEQKRVGEPPTKNYN